MCQTGCQHPTRFPYLSCVRTVNCILMSCIKAFLSSRSSSSYFKVKYLIVMIFLIDESYVVNTIDNFKFCEHHLTKNVLFNININLTEWLLGMASNCCLDRLYLNLTTFMTSSLVKQWNIHMKTPCKVESDINRYTILLIITNWFYFIECLFNKVLLEMVKCDVFRQNNMSALELKLLLSSWYQWYLYSHRQATLNEFWRALQLIQCFPVRMIQGLSLCPSPNFALRLACPYHRKKYRCYLLPLSVYFFYDINGQHTFIKHYNHYVLIQNKANYWQCLCIG